MIVREELVRGDGFGPHLRPKFATAGDEVPDNGKNSITPVTTTVAWRSCGGQRPSNNSKQDSNGCRLQVNRQRSSKGEI